jgi:hypothetical protein
MLEKQIVRVCLCLLQRSWGWPSARNPCTSRSKIPAVDHDEIIVVLMLSW